MSSFVQRPSEWSRRGRPRLYSWRSRMRGVRERANRHDFHHSRWIVCCVLFAFHSLLRMGRVLGVVRALASPSHCHCSVWRAGGVKFRPAILRAQSYIRKTTGRRWSFQRKHAHPPTRYSSSPCTHACPNPPLQQKRHTYSSSSASTVHNCRCVFFRDRVCRGALSPRTKNKKQFQLARKCESGPRSLL